MKDRARLQFSGKYPRFKPVSCGECIWEAERKQEATVEVRNLKSGKKWSLNSEKPHPLDKDHFISAHFYEETDEVRLFVYKMNQKNLAKKRQRTFYPYDSKAIYQSRFQWLDKPKMATIQRSDGSRRDLPIVAELHLQIAKKSYVLSVYNYDPGKEDYRKEEKAMLLYRDSSNGKKTYGAGRFLNVYFPKEIGGMKSGDSVAVDFNFSYNPPCAVSTGYHCPLPQDFIAVAMERGEKYNKIH